MVRLRPIEEANTRCARSGPVSDSCDPVFEGTRRRHDVLESCPPESESGALELERRLLHEDFFAESLNLNFRLERPFASCIAERRDPFEAVLPPEI